MKAWLRAATPDAAYRLYRRWKVGRLISTYEPRRTTHSYAGTSLTLLLSDPLAEGWYDHDWLEPPEIGFVRGVLGGALVFDLGAHQGVYALLLAAAGARVVAVEASPHNARAAEENLRLNPMLGNRITVLEAAVASAPGTARVTRELNASVSVVGTDRVEAVTVDELAQIYGTPDVMYVDIEGFELQALNGARQSLKRRPWCVIEVHAGMGLEDAGGSVEALLDVFAVDDYRLYASTEAEAFAEVNRSQPPVGRFFLVAEPRSQPSERAGTEARI